MPQQKQRRSTLWLAVVLRSQHTALPPLVFAYPAHLGCDSPIRWRLRPTMARHQDPLPAKAELLAQSPWLMVCFSDQTLGPEMVAEVLLVGAQEVVGAVRVPQEVVATTAAVPQEVVAAFVVPHEVAAVVELVVVPREVVAAVVQPQEMVAAGVLVAVPRGQRGELQASP